MQTLIAMPGVPTTGSTWIVAATLCLILRSSAAMLLQQDQQAQQGDANAVPPYGMSNHLNDCYQEKNRCGSHRFYSIDTLEEMQNKTDSLKDCCVIEGDLQLVLLEKVTFWQNVTFPRLVEITGFLLVFRVYNLTSLGKLFPNLATIRGLTTHQGYSLVLYDNRDLKEVGLYSLTSILKGYVRIQYNINLCYDTTINWNKICKAKDSEKKNWISDSFGWDCPPCPKSCKSGFCWSETVCQPDCSENCDGDCDPTTQECCHEQCAGGCTEPNDSSKCTSCKNYNNFHDNECVETCPGHNRQKHLKYICIKDAECQKMVEEKEYKFLKYPNGNECVKDCPPGYTVKGRDCKKCEGDNDCGKTCGPAVVNTIEKAQTLKSCTKINGTLIISLTGGRNITEKLEEALANIVIVTDYIRIFNSKSLLSLNFFKSLRFIYGENLARDKYALYVHDNDNLENLWENDSTQLSIGEGEIFFHSNPKLCYKYIENLIKTSNITVNNKTKDFMKSLNGQKVVCNTTLLTLETAALHETGALELKWQALNPKDHRLLLGYTVYYQRADSGNLSRFGGRDACSQQWSSDLIDDFLDNGSTERYILRDLIPATRYGIYVQTETLATADKNAWSAITYESTLPSNPGEVEDLRVIKANETSLELAWSQPKQPNGVIEYYIINVTPKEWPKEWPLDPFDNCPIYADTDANYEDGARKDPEEKQIELNNTEVDDQSCCQCSSSKVNNRKQVMDFEDELITLVYFKNKEYQREKREVWSESSEEQLTTLPNFEKKKWTRVKRSIFNNEGNDRIERPQCSNPKTLQNHSSCVNGCHIKTQSTKFIITDLQHSTPYYITVEACQYINKSCSLCTKHPKTHNATTTHKENADLVQNLKVSELFNGEFRNVTWDAPESPNGPIIGYKLKISHKRPWCVNSSVNFYRIRISDLQSGIIYSFQVEALLSRKEYKSYLPYPANSTFYVSGPLNAPNDGKLLLLGIGAAALAFLCLMFYAIWRLRDTKPKNYETYETMNANYGELLIILNSTDIDECAGNESPGHNAYMAIQNDPTTYWHPTGLEKHYNNWFITFNFKDTYRVSTINLKNYGDTIHDVKEFKLETSYDHLNWNFVYSENNVRTGTKELQKFGTRTTTCGQFWKFTVTATASGEAPKLVLINFYGCHVSHNMNWVEILRGNIDPMYIHDRDKLTLDEKKLGKGHFGVVKRGTLKWKGREVEVAVKQLTDFRERESLIQEAKIMLGLECNHVVRTYGVVPEGLGLYLVMDLMIKGDLLEYLKGKNAEDNNIFSELTLDRVCVMAVQIADGMAYLAFKNIVHRDLAARNCLLDEKENVKISDFGMTRIVTNYYRIQESRKIPVRWMPPEMLKNSRFSNQSDVWSYGIVVYEIVTGGCRPYKDLPDDAVVSYIKTGRTLESEMPKESPKFLVDLVSRCWNFSEHCRPSFPEIIYELLPNTSPCFQMYFRTPGMSFYQSPDGRNYKAKMEAEASYEDDSHCWESCSGPTTPLTATSRLGILTKLTTFEDKNHCWDTSRLGIVPPMLPPRNNVGHSFHSDINSVGECPSDEDTFTDLPYDTDYDSSAYAHKGQVMVQLGDTYDDRPTSSMFRPGYAT